MNPENDAIKRMQKDALARLLGIELKQIEPGYARAVLKVKPELLNGVGITHGGAIFSLADVAFAAASNAHGPVALALDMHISFVKSTTAGETLTAVAREENITARTGLYRIEITDDRGDLIAVAQGRVYRKV